MTWYSTTSWPCWSSCWWHNITSWLFVWLAEQLAATSAGEWPEALGLCISKYHSVLNIVPLPTNTCTYTIHIHRHFIKQALSHMGTHNIILTCSIKTQHPREDRVHLTHTDNCPKQSLDRRQTIQYILTRVMEWPSESGCLPAQNKLPIKWSVGAPKNNKNKSSAQHSEFHRGIKELFKTLFFHNYHPREWISYLYP